MLVIRKRSVWGHKVKSFMTRRKLTLNSHVVLPTVLLLWWISLCHHQIYPRPSWTQVPSVSHWISVLELLLCPLCRAMGRKRTVTCSHQDPHRLFRPVRMCTVISAMTKVTPNLKTVPPSLLTVAVAGVSLVAMALRTRCTHSYTGAESASFMCVVIVGRRVYIPDINTTWLNDTWRIVICNVFQVFSWFLDMFEWTEFQPIPWLSGIVDYLCI